MTQEEILKQVNTIFIDILDSENIVIKPGTTANDIEEWDSLTHIQLVVGIEKYFKIRFKSDEINSFKNVGEMCHAISVKIS